MHQSTNPTADPFKNTTTQAVASFINGAAPDENGRCMATAMLTLSMWQIAPEPFTASVPSVLLVNAGDAQNDPLDGFAEEFVFNLGWLEQSLSDGSNVKDPHIPGDARKGMHMAVWGAGQLPPDHIYTDRNRSQFHNYRARDYGDGPGYRYTRAWTEEYGWLSNHDNRLVLRLDQADDRKALREDLLNGSKKLHDAKGLGWELVPVSKKLAFSGSLHSGEWDEALVTKMITGGWPVLFIPHSVTVPLSTEHKPNLHLACRMVAAFTWHSRVTALDALPDDPWLQHHNNLLRMRLANMPADYGFAIQRIVRELGDVCMRLAHAICRDNNDVHVTSLVGQDLYRMTLRAIVIGVAALGYHCWGFTARLRTKGVALMHHLRTHGPSSRRDLQRKFPAMDLEERDELLKILEDEGLIECTGRQMSAVPLSGYIMQLQGRTEFPQTGALSNLLLGHKVPKAGPLPGVEVEKRRRRRKPAHDGGDAPEAEAGGESVAGPEPETGMPGCHGAVA